MSSFLHTRRQFFYGTAVAGATALAGDSILIEPNRPKLVRLDFALRRWPERMNGFTIALLSDFHYDPIFSRHPLLAAIPMVNNLRPDLIVLTGDFVSVPLTGDEARGALAAEPCAQFLRKLTAPFGLWAVLGNHDVNTDPKFVTRALEGVGIHMLVNQSVPIELDGGRFWLSGVDDVLSGAADLEATLRNVPSTEPAILLAHEPDFADDAARYPVDLQLSGHSHGGQVRIPFLGPVYLPELAKKYVLGRYQVGPLPLYTNAGIGTVDAAVRFNCPPEVTFITLRATTPI
ncbi:MAG TPA: metallophosphoesterase [Candidatus Sulfotelmatobacter sp.]